jgi:eukaryotic-like serine/threonine-protein kinase
VPERFLGHTLGKFRIDGIIGTGGFAWVYKAYDPELEIPVALKVLKPQYAGDEQFEQRFRREAATAARLRHPNIIKIFAVGKDGEAVYFAMDFLPQGLPERLEVMTKLPEPVLIRMGIDVASALGFAHREGVVHRDIKVDNILFDEHGNAIVADFGIARAVSNYIQQTGTNMVVGTPQYFSPEQARGQQLDGRADIYSLGVTLYRSAAGVLPFTGEDWYEIARQHVEERPVRPRVHNPQLSRDVERVILRCLEKDPAARYQTGEALCQALAGLSLERSDTIAMRSTPSPTSSETPTAPIPLPGARARRWSRSVLRSGVAAAALVALVVGAQAARRALAGSRTDPKRAGATTLAPTPSVAPGTAPGAGSTTTVVSSTGNDVKPLDSSPTPVTASARSRSASGARRAGRPSPTTTGVTESPSGAGATDGTPVTPPPVDRGVGTVHLDTRPDGASYVLEALDDGRIIRGRTPLTGPITLPVGAYAITVSAHYCASYRDTVRITINHPAPPLHVRLVCGE